MGSGCFAVVMMMGLRAGANLRTDGVRGLHLQGYRLARNYGFGVSIAVRKPGIIFVYSRVFTKICMLAVLLDLLVCRGCLEVQAGIAATVRLPRMHGPAGLCNAGLSRVTCRAIH